MREGRELQSGKEGIRPTLGPKFFFTPEGKETLMFLKMFTGLNCPKMHK